jgi:uncharacterized protein (DUF697 family)
VVVATGCVAAWVGEAAVEVGSTVADAVSVVWGVVVAVSVAGVGVAPDSLVSGKFRDSARLLEAVARAMMEAVLTTPNEIRNSRRPTRLFFSFAASTNTG